MALDAQAEWIRGDAAEIEALPPPSCRVGSGFRLLSRDGNGMCSSGVPHPQMLGVRGSLEDHAVG